jgi:hypothetical protein
MTVVRQDMRIVGASRPSAHARGCVVVDAVVVEPVSTLKFPANREINREFCDFRLIGAILIANQQANSNCCSEIPYVTEQGIFWR